MANFEDDIFTHTLTYRAITEVFNEAPSAQVRALQPAWPSPHQRCTTAPKAPGLAGTPAELRAPAVEPSFQMMLPLPARSGSSASCRVQQPCAFEGCSLPALEQGCWECWQRERLGHPREKSSAASLCLNSPWVCFSANLLAAGPQLGCKGQGGAGCMSGF